MSNEVGWTPVDVASGGRAGNKSLSEQLTATPKPIRINRRPARGGGSMCAGAGRKGRQVALGPDQWTSNRTSGPQLVHSKHMSPARNFNPAHFRPHSADACCVLPLKARRRMFSARGSRRHQLRR